MSARSIPATAPTAYHVLAKPTGAACNLDCTYCFYLPKAQLYPGSRSRMADDVLDSYIRQLIESQPVPEVTIAWQGGEPTLMGLAFFRRAVACAEQYRRPGTTLAHTMQTNGILLDAEWCTFFREHRFLLGLSLDGPRELHDTYRLDKGGKPTFHRVMRALRLLQQHRVDVNILTTVNAANVEHPLDIYRFLRDEAGAQVIQFIPVVERVNAQRSTGLQEGETVTERSVTARQWGRFLNTTFDEWVRHDIGRVFVQIFEAALAAWVGEPSALCIFAETCGDAVALEHNGDLYACDHFVDPGYLLGNIRQLPMLEMVASDRQRAFGLAKRDTLPRYCLECEVRFACNGECPKNRFVRTPDGEPGLNYLCAGYKAFFTHVDQPMRSMAELLRRHRTPADVMAILQAESARLRAALVGVGRNDPRPCGSGRKVKHCHGASEPRRNGRQGGDKPFAG